MASDQLPESTLVSFRESFKKFDKEDSNTINTEDVAGVLRAAGQAPTESELEDFKKELDPKDSGEVDYKDLLNLFTRILKDTFEMNDELVEAFKTFDKNLDGYILAADLRRYMTTLGETLSPEEVDEMIKDADSNGDGKINYTEFSYALINDNTQ